MWGQEDRSPSMVSLLVLVLVLIAKDVSNGW